MIARNFFREKQGAKRVPRFRPLPSQRDENGYVHVPMYSELFSSLKDNMLCTNSMYSSLRDDIEASVEMYRTKEKIVLDVFEPEESDEFNRERTVIGFRRYMAACCVGIRRRHLIRMLSFYFFLVMGILILFFLYGWVPDLFSTWVAKCIDTVGTVLVWQFVGYMAFEFPGEIKSIRRMKQLSEIEFQFKKWV